MYILIALFSVPSSLRAQGFLDDKSEGGWHELCLGIADFGISLLGASL
jgi:hypothetical protein